MKQYLLICGVIFFLFVAARTGVGQETKVAEIATCSTLLLTRCDTCHYLTRVCYQLEKKSSRKWKRTLKAMVSRGAKLTKDEQNRLLTCLSEPEEETQKTCREYLGP